ncbi:MAG: methyltransferase domain-containing protein [Parachlamydiaceae bacterium]|nr:methyltransferase domain-containing protein [Parachlamydiaceae bacterium]
MKLKNFFRKTVFIMGLLSIINTNQIWSKTTEEVFNDIYKNKSWGKNSSGEGFSGTGSTLKNTVEYRQFLADFFTAYNIKSVVDAGCGDWTFSQEINWSGINYKGYDLVKFVIEKNRANFGSENIKFFHQDATKTNKLPAADLLICKDVLQHLPLEDISVFLQNLKQFKFCLITNDIDPKTGTSTNPQIKPGSYRTLDLTQPPFLLKGTKIFTFWSGRELKQVLLLTN